jgi:hypothetical protein
MSNRVRLTRSLALVSAAILAACNPQARFPIGEAAPQSGRTPTASLDCAVTRPSQPSFVPPSPWPQNPPSGDQFWFGSAGLWTALPRDGSWRQLAIVGVGDKFWWWSEDYGAGDVASDSTPDLTVAARRIDGSSPSFNVSEATNGFHSSFNQAMLIGVELASPGCWEFSAQFMDSELSFVVWVPSE